MRSREARWRDDAEGPLAMCRVTQMSVLRLLTNDAAMAGHAQTHRDAWAFIDRQLADPDVIWLQEPDGVERIWRILSGRDDRHHKLWTDDYLAFAQAAGATLVTLNRAVARRYPSVAVVAI